MFAVVRVLSSMGQFLLEHLRRAAGCCTGKLKVQLDEVIDYYEWKRTDEEIKEMTRQILFELDHSSGHARRDEGAIRSGSLWLNPYNQYQEKGYDAEQLYFTDISVTAEGLGPHLYDASDQLIPGKLEAGDMRKCRYGRIYDF